MDKNHQKKSILYSGLVSFGWLFESKEIAEKDEQFGKYLKNYESYSKGPIINAGVLIAFSYLTLVFPREAALYEELNFANLTTEKFQVLKGSYKDKKDLLRHLRNAIAHANIQLEHGYIVLKDRDFEVKILTKDFGNFLNQLVTEWRNCEIRKNK